MQIYLSGIENSVNWGIWITPDTIPRLLLMDSVDWGKYNIPNTISISYAFKGLHFKDYIVREEFSIQAV